MNTFICIGNMTREPELNTTPSGVSVCRFSVAVARPFDRDKTDFFNVTAWRGLAENVVKFCEKGSKVAISGYLQQREYEDNKGNKQRVIDVIAQEIEFLSRKKEEKGEQTAVSPTPIKPKQQVLQAFEDDSDIPF